MAKTSVKKKSTAAGNKFSYKYTDLATIHEELEKQHILYRQYTEFDEHARADYVYTSLKYGEDGWSEPMRGAKIVEANTLTGGNMAQQYGSALTYARRYSLLMALGWATEDDDAASAGNAKPAASKRLDFQQVRQYLDRLKTAEEVIAAYKKIKEKCPNLTDKQEEAISMMVDDKIKAIKKGE